MRSSTSRADLPIQEASDRTTDAMQELVGLSRSACADLSESGPIGVLHCKASE